MAARRLDPLAGAAAVTAWSVSQAASGEPPPRATVALAVRYTLQVLADRVPGRSVEVRVPPYGVVQCIQGPRHTRGTPANIVETDPQTWLALATGATTWAQAGDTGRVRASGVRADLGAVLPLVAPIDPAGKLQGCPNPPNRSTAATPTRSIPPAGTGSGAGSDFPAS